MAASTPQQVVSSTRTTCPYCGVGCGVVIDQDKAGEFHVRGDEAHPASFGRLCSKGTALGETLATTGRLHQPSVNGEDTDWDTALEHIAARFSETIEKYGPDSVAFYVSGQLLTEDYYVANKFVKGWLGNANIDTNSRLCMASSVAGHKRAFGTDTVPGCYEDLELADIIVLVGSNLAWCHPVIYQRIAAAREARPELKIVLVDPRRTATVALADQHLAVRPDSDLDLFAGLLADLVRTDRIDTAYVESHVDGFADAAAAVADLELAIVSQRTGLAESELADFYELFGQTQRVVTVYSQGVNQSQRGTDTVNAIIDCHLATGRIGHPGMGPFSVTGQPNAMGGREVGGLANMLAAHTDIENAEARDRVQTFWQSPRIASETGPKAVDLFQRVADGRVRALWVMATNPVDSMPAANRVRQAIADCPFVVVSDVVPDTDTTRLADVLLPSAAWSEKDGTVTNSERRISRQRGFRSPPGEARPDWWQIAEVAKRLGWEEAFDWSGPAAIFREHAALSEAAGSPDFDIGAMQGIDDAEYDALEPFQWPRRAGEEVTTAPMRFFATGGFHTPNGRARMPALQLGAPPGSSDSECGDDMMVLNTGRIRDQWHTMTRTGHLNTLSNHLAEPFAEIAPVDAERLGIDGAEIVEIVSSHSGEDSSVRVRALITDRQAAGAVFVPFHWTDMFASQARVDALVSPVVDPVSGQPASKSERVQVRPWQVRSYGFMVTAVLPRTLPDRDSHYWALSPTKGGWRIEVASLDDAHSLMATCLAMVEHADILEIARYTNAAERQQRRILSVDGHGIVAVFVSPEPVLVSRAWASALLCKDISSLNYRWLAGRPGADQPDAGAIVCSCHEVGVNTIRHAIAEQGCNDLASVGRTCAAGTNCGSCRPEVQRLIDATAPAAAGSAGSVIEQPMVEDPVIAA